MVSAASCSPEKVRRPFLWARPRMRVRRHPQRPPPPRAPAMSSARMSAQPILAGLRVRRGGRVLGVISRHPELTPTVPRTSVTMAPRRMNLTLTGRIHSHMRRRATMKQPPPPPKQSALDQTALPTARFGPSRREPPYSSGRRRWRSDLVCGHMPIWCRCPGRGLGRTLLISPLRCGRSWRRSARRQRLLRQRRIRARDGRRCQGRRRQRGRG
jgi:hypothetical protein